MDERSLKGELGVDQATGNDADEQGGIDLLGDKGEEDGKQGREDGPEGSVCGDVLADGIQRLGDVGLEVGVRLDVVGVVVNVFLCSVMVGEICGGSLLRYLLGLDGRAVGLWIAC